MTCLVSVAVLRAGALWRTTSCCGTHTSWSTASMLRRGCTTAATMTGRRCGGGLLGGGHAAGGVAPERQPRARWERQLVASASHVHVERDNCKETVCEGVSMPRLLCIPFLAASHSFPWFLPKGVPWVVLLSSCFTLQGRAASTCRGIHPLLRMGALCGSHVRTDHFSPLAGGCHSLRPGTQHFWCVRGGSLISDFQRQLKPMDSTSLVKEGRMVNVRRRGLYCMINGASTMPGAEWQTSRACVVQPPALPAATPCAPRPYQRPIPQQPLHVTRSLKQWPARRCPSRPSPVWHHARCS